MQDLVAMLVFPSLGALLVLGAIAGFVRQWARFGAWTATEGVVIAHRIRHGRRGGRVRSYHHPVLRFTAAGREWDHESPLSTSQKRYEEGTRVPLLFDPGNPESVCIDDVREKYFVPMLLGAIGCIFLLVGAWLVARAYLP